jgi:hypothetical protein
MTKRLNVIWFVAFVVGVFVAFKLYEYHNFHEWQSRFEPYGIKYNSTRQQLGIPLIEEGWYTETTSTTRPKRRRYRQENDNPWAFQIWESHREVPVTIDKAFHKSKEISRRRGSLEYESDLYCKRVNDSTEMLLEVKFRYLFPRDSAWSAALVTTTQTQEDVLVDQKDISIEQADSLLTLWGLSRTNVSFD